MARDLWASEKIWRWLGSVGSLARRWCFVKGMANKSNVVPFEMDQEFVWLSVL